MRKAERYYHATTPSKAAVVELRPDQADAFAALVANGRSILNAPTGWGKSITLVAAAAQGLLEDPRLKVVFTVPQRIISAGFVKDVRFLLPGGGHDVAWRVGRNLCEPGPRKIDELRRFLLTPAGGGAAGRTVVTTHQSFAQAAAALTGDELAVALRNTWLVVDEAQHVSVTDVACNTLGEAVARLLAVDDPTTRITLATAYFFRGDRLPILRDGQLRLFARHHVPFDEYWSGLKHIKTYAYDFVAYRGTPWAEMEALLRRSQEPTIFFCPPDGHRLHLGRDKQCFVERVVGLIWKHYAAPTLWTPALPAGTRDVVVNFVDGRHRSEKIDFVMGHGQDVCAVLTVGMFREGADWPRASRVIDLIPSGSDQDRNQRFGRLIRDHPGKAHVGYYSFLPRITHVSQEAQRKQLTTLFAHFHATLVLGNAIRPLKVPVPPPPSQPPTTGGEASGDGGDRAVDLLGRFGEKEQEAILRDCCSELIRAAAETAAEGGEVGPEEARRVVVGVLRNNHGIGTHADELAVQVVALLRRGWNVGGTAAADLVKAGFDKVWGKEVLDGFLVFSGGVGGPTTFGELRRAVGTAFEAAWRENYAAVAALPTAPGSGSSTYWWCTHNKVLRAQGALAADRVKLLEGIPWWTWAEGFDARWEKRHGLIAALPQPPAAGTTDYGWVRQQRRLRQQGRLAPDRVELCERIPWWSWASLDGNWEAAVRAVELLPEKPRAATKEYDLVKYWRKRHAEGKLPKDRAERLETIPWWTWAGDSATRHAPSAA